MAFFKGDIFSKSMEMHTSLNVILPQDAKAPAKTLYLLHGLSDNASNWQRMTSVERYATAYGVAVVMPEVQRSFYTDTHYGLSYFTYIADELPKICRALFHLSPDRADNCIAGLSMGGYGALKIGMSRPDQFFACAGFSSVADIRACLQRPEYKTVYRSQITGVFGPDCTPPDRDDLFAISSALAQKDPSVFPRIYMTCGRQDDLYDYNLRLKTHLESLPLPYRYEEWDGGHDWAFWDTSLQKAMRFFFEIPSSQEG